MSLILDALNRSEENRRQKIDGIPRKKILNISGHRGHRNPVRWLFVTVFLLFMLLCLLLWSSFRPGVTLPAVGTDVPAAEVRAKIVAERPVVKAHPDGLLSQPSEDILSLVSPPNSQAVSHADIDEKQDLFLSPSAQNPATESSLQPVSDLTKVFPDLSLSMHYYNPLAERRLVRINGQLLHQGDVVDGRLIIDEITPGGVIIKFRGFLYVLKRPGG
jgi:hypothetical protein